MYHVVDQIRYDHISMSRILFLTERELARLKSGEDADFGLMLDCMRYMKDYAEAVHHPKEDAVMDCIYGRSPDLDVVIDEIKLQHRSMNEKSTAFLDIIRSAAMEQFEEKSNILALGQDYIRGQRSHMRLEEERLLRKSKELLSRSEVKEINQRYSEYSDPQIEDNFEEEYTRLYQTLTGNRIQNPAT